MTTDRSQDAGIGMVLMLLILYLSLKWKGLLYAAIALLILNMIWPRLFAPLGVVWLGLFSFLGTVASMILLSIAFFAVVTPFAILRRLLGKDSLKLHAFKASKGSAMVARNHTFTGRDIETPY